MKDWENKKKLKKINHRQFLHFVRSERVTESHWGGSKLDDKCDTASSRGHIRSLISISGERVYFR